MSLTNKINYSISLLKKAERLALRMNPEGFHLAFSGGKDSMVLYHLAKMANVKFTAHMQITTVDPPELMRFVRNTYPDVRLHRPEINFYELIKKKKMLPLRQARFCCAYLKEQAGRGSVTCTGIRAAESAKRAKRLEFEGIGKNITSVIDQFNRDKEISHECIDGIDKIILNPIHKGWADRDVWEFIRGEKLEYCSLHDEGFHRIGCMFCPMTTRKTKYQELKRYPGVANKIIQSIQYLIDTNGYMNNHNASAEETFMWWISNKASDEYFFDIRYQLKLF